MTADVLTFRSMRQRLAAVGLVCVIVASVVTGAQSPSAAPTKSSIKNPVTVRGKYLSLVVGSNATTVAPGAQVTLLVEVTPRPRMHLYAPGQAGYIPVNLSVAENPAFTTKAPVYPASTPYTFAPTAEAVKVYAGQFMIRADLVVASSAALKSRAAKGDTLSVAGAFEYQACDDAVCYRPEKLPVEWKLGLTGKKE